MFQPQTKLQSHSRQKWDPRRGRGYYNPDPLYQLIGLANETELNIEGVRMKALIDSGTQISAISKSMGKTLGLPIRKLETLLDIEGSAGSDVPYLGYTELRLDIPEIAKFDHDVLMMVYPDSNYSHRVPVIIGTLHIDEALDLATYDELASLSRGWKRGIVGCRIIAKQLSLKGPGSEPVIHKLGGNVKLTKAITMAPRQAIKTMGLTEIAVLNKRVNVVTEAIDKLQDGKVELLSSYESIKPGSQRVAVALYNTLVRRSLSRKVPLWQRVLLQMSFHPCWHLLLVRSRTYLILVMDWTRMDAKTGMYHPMERMFPPDHQSQNLPRRD